MEKHDKTLIASEKEMVEKQKKQEILYEFENIETRFGRNVRRLRRQQHLTQEDLADLYFRCGIRKKKCVASGSGTLGESIESR